MFEFLPRPDALLWRLRQPGGPCDSDYRQRNAIHFDALYPNSASAGNHPSSTAYIWNGKGRQNVDPESFVLRLAKIGTELHSEYILGYWPSNKTRDACWRQIAVKVHSRDGLKHVSVNSKMGYYPCTF